MKNNPLKTPPAQLAYQKKYAKERYDDLKRLKLCVKCGKTDPQPGYMKCVGCRVNLGLLGTTKCAACRELGHNVRSCQNK